MIRKGGRNIAAVGVDRFAVASKAVRVTAAE
jgi:hypothetical protein